RNELAAGARLELDLDPLFEDADPALLEARGLVLGEGLVHEIAERRAAPDRKRFSEPTCIRQCLEALEVELAGLDPRGVARASAFDAVRAECLAHPRDIGVERLAGIVGRLLAPDPVDQPVARDALVRVEEEDREQGALLRATEGDRLSAV